MSNGMLRTAGVLLVISLALIVPAGAAAATSDLSVTLSDSADPVIEDTTFSLNVAVTNGGPETATAVELLVELPNRLDFVAAISQQGSCTNQGKKITCALGGLESTATTSVEVRVTPTRPDAYVSSATVSSLDTDPQPANNTATVTTTAIAKPAAPTCGGEPATVLGSGGDDQLVGTEKRDVIVALGGNDVVRGLGGNDLICTASGADTIRGEAGADVIRSGGGNDAIKGGDDNDLLRAGGGDDRLGGGRGADTLRGGGGADACNGGPGRDDLKSC